MKTIPLTQGKFALVDDADYKWLKRHGWFASKDRYTYYAMRTIRVSKHKRRNILMHRIILNAPDGVEVDHRNSDGLDNRRSNLRLCSRQENSRHQRLFSNNKAGFKGITFDKRVIQKPYMARIRVNNKRISLGYYPTPEQAARAYDEAALEHFGEFALTNAMLGLVSCGK